MLISTITALRRASTPYTPALNRNAANTSGYISGIAGSPRLSVAAGEDDGADQGGQQQHADRLEGQHVVAEQRFADGGGGGGGLVLDPLAAEGVGQEQREGEEHAGPDHESPDPGPQGVVQDPAADRGPGQHDPEQDQDHDRAHVDDHLHEGHERGGQEQVDPGDAGQGDDQVEGRVDDVAAGHHQQPGQPADQGQDQESDLLAGHDPDPPPRWAARSLRA